MRSRRLEAASDCVCGARCRSKDHVVEVQKGDLVAGYVNQTAAKTAKKIAEAKGGILFVDEAYQLTQALMRGQSDFSGESIDEMMKCMLSAGRKSVTFIFAGCALLVAEAQRRRGAERERCKKGESRPSRGDAHRSRAPAPTQAPHPHPGTYLLGPLTRPTYLLGTRRRWTSSSRTTLGWSRASSAASDSTTAPACVPLT